MKLRDYQKKMYKAAVKALTDQTPRASFYAATGSGKTVVFMKVIEHLFNQNETAKVLVVHPRIALSSDQQERFRAVLQVPYTSFHSGSVVQSTTRDNVVNIFNRSTTSRGELVNILDEQKDNNHIVFTTYKSLEKIADMDFDLIICDEAHYLASSEFAKNLDLFRSQTLFFTATPITSGMDYSMDSIEKFGPVIAEVTPSTLIERGFMVAPQLFYTKIATDGSGDFEDFVESIGQTFVAQRDMLSDEIPHKMLVAMPDTMQFDSIMNRVADIRAIAGQDLDVYYITAGMNKRNGSIIASREEALKQFAASQIPSIIIHCDTLAEGIDIDGLTGAYLARGLGQAKFIQTIGRCVRPYRDDYLETGNVKALSRRIKKFAPIHVAVVDGELRGSSDIKDWYQALFDAGYPNVKGIMAGGDATTGGEQVYDVDFFEKVNSRILNIEFERAVVEFKKFI